MEDEFRRLSVRSADRRGRRPGRAKPAPDAGNIRMPLFSPGTRVSYQGALCTVNHVMISRGQLMVHLSETHRLVPAEQLFVEPTRILLRKT